MNRFAALHACPVFSKRPATAASTVASRSFVLSTRNGSDPPSSSTTFFRLRPGDLGDGGAGALRPGERDTLHPRVGDRVGDLLVRRVHVDVGALREPGVGEDLLDRRRRFRALRRMLEHDRVAQRQVRAGEARHLVVGVVPRHDAEQHADRSAPDDRAALALDQLDGLVGEELLGVVGVVAVDRAAEIDLAERLVERLAHLALDDLGEVVAAFGVQLADAPHQRRALGDGRGLRPFPKRLVRVGDRLAHLLVGRGRVLAHRLAGRGIDHRIQTHDALPRRLVGYSRSYNDAGRKGGESQKHGRGRCTVGRGGAAC